MTIITDLYNKVLNFFNNENKEDTTTKDTACNRLKLVLMQDRAKLEPAIMEKMRKEMIDVISKYIEIDTEALDLNLEAEGETFALMLNIPVIRAKTKEEIEAAENIESTSEDDDDDDDDDEIEDIEEDDSEETDEAESEDEEDTEDSTEEDTKEVESDDVDEDAIDSGTESETSVIEDKPDKKPSESKKKSSQKKKEKPQESEDE